MLSHEISGKKFQQERSLFRLKDTILRDCIFQGPADGESPLKHPENVLMENCSFSLRYPIWHRFRRHKGVTRLSECSS